MQWIVFYERPENTLRSLGPMSELQALRLVESFYAQGIAYYMEPDEGQSLEPVTITPLPDFEQRPTYSEQVSAFSRSLIDEAMAASGGNQKKAALALGLKRTTLHGYLKKSRNPVKARAQAAGSAT